MRPLPGRLVHAHLKANLRCLSMLPVTGRPHACPSKSCGHHAPPGSLGLGSYPVGGSSAAAAPWLLTASCRQRFRSSCSKIAAPCGLTPRAKRASLCNKVAATVMTCTPAAQRSQLCACAPVLPPLLCACAATFDCVPVPMAMQAAACLPTLTRSTATC